MLDRIKINMPRLLRFGLVGILGAVINFAIYSGVMKFTTLGINVSSIAAFCVAVINNYIINHSWTFAAENHNNPINRTQFTYYVLGNLIGLSANLLVLNTIVAMVGIEFHIIGQLLGIACGMIFSFFFAKKVVFSSVVRMSRNISE